MNIFQAILMDLACLIFPKTLKPLRREYCRRMDESKALYDAANKALNDDFRRVMKQTSPTFSHHHDQERTRRGL